MDGNIGYLKFDRFTDLQLAKEIITGVMNFICSSSAIILDLRDNGGGDADASEFFINYFFPDGEKLGDIKFRKENQSKEIIIKHEPSIQKIGRNVPVYILVSNKTASAAEAASYFLQQFNRAVIIGEHTGGKANPGELFAVNDFLFIMIPTGHITVLPTGTNWEGSGVIPDVKIDPLLALPEAVKEICSVLEKQDTNEEHRILYRWISEQYEAQLNQQFSSEQFINNIIGNYENNRKIIFENGIVYYIGSTGFKRRLTYLGNQTFMIEGRNDYRLRFQDNNKTADYYEVLWYDGTSEKVNRNR
jgi:C-terminal processing protease CtpA/Prc